MMANDLVCLIFIDNPILEILEASLILKNIQDTTTECFKNYINSVLFIFSVVIATKSRCILFVYNNVFISDTDGVATPPGPGTHVYMSD